MEFNSQICTTEEQSKRLLALGLKKETADMMYVVLVKDFRGKDVPNAERIYSLCTWYKETSMSVGLEKREYIPAWSLSRLLAMFPSFIDIGEYTYIFRIIQGRLFSYRNNIAGDVWLYSMGGVYNSAIYTIEWLIGEGCFNKEYLDK